MGCFGNKVSAQWKQLVKQYISTKVDAQLAMWQMGYRLHELVLIEIDEQPCQCPECGQQFSKRRALEMHCKRTHGVRPEARVFVLGSFCPWCGDDHITRPRVIAHRTRGALACSLAWTTGCLPHVHLKRFWKLICVTDSKGNAQKPLVATQASVFRCSVWLKVVRSIGTSHHMSAPEFQFSSCGTLAHWNDPKATLYWSTKVVKVPCTMVCQAIVPRRWWPSTVLLVFVYNYYIYIFCYFLLNKRCFRCLKRCFDVLRYLNVKYNYIFVM
jgi:hypothetical protein